VPAIGALFRMSDVVDVSPFSESDSRRGCHMLLQHAVRASLVLVVAE